MLRKFFALSAGLAVCSVAGLATAGDLEVNVMGAQKAVPTRVARFSYEGELLSPWYEYTDGGVAHNANNCSPDLAYETYWADAAGFPTNRDDKAGCGIAEGNRYIFNTCMSQFTSGITFAAGSGGTEVDHVDILFYNQVGEAETFYYGVGTFDDWLGDDCVVPAGDNDLGGVLIGFAGDAGFWFSNVDLCDFGIGVPVPADEDGALWIQLLGSDDGGTTFRPANCASPGLWNLDPTAPIGGNSDNFAWDIFTNDGAGNCVIDPIENDCANVPDGVIDIDMELCWASPACVWDTLLASIDMYAPMGPTDCLDLAVDNLVAGETAVFTLTGGTPGVAGAVLYDFNLGSLTLDNVVNGGFTWCVDFGLDIPAAQATAQIVIQGVFNGSGEIQNGKPIPGSALGLTVNFQGAESETCPDYCMSGIVTETVQ